MPEVSENQGKINWKTVLIVVVIGAILVGLGVWIFLLLQPKPKPTSPITTKIATPSAKISTPSAKKDETADWKVYNSELGFSLKYPQDFVLNRIEGLNTDVIDLWGPTQGQGQDFHDGLSISFNDLPEVGTLEKTANQDMTSIKERFKSRTGENQTFTLSNFSIGKSTPAIRSEYPNYGSSAYITYIYIELGSGKILRIDGTHGGEKDSEYIKTLNSILSTFRFD